MENVTRHVKMKIASMMTAIAIVVNSLRKVQSKVLLRNMYLKTLSFLRFVTSLGFKAM